jgi:drug/metabolite transporter (DMT)-like permease
VLLQNKYQKSLAELHLVVFIWGFTAILGKLISVSALDLTLYRMPVALLGMWAYTHWRGGLPSLPLRARLALWGTGLIIALHWLTFYHAIKISHISVTLAGFSSGAFFAALFEPLIEKRRISRAELGLSLWAVASLSIIFRAESDFAGGMLLAVFSAALSALFAVLNGRFARIYPPKAVAIHEMLGGWLGVLPVWLFMGVSGSGFQIPTLQDAGWILVLALICTAYPFLASIRLMKQITAFTLVLTINLEPLYGIGFARLIFGESEHMSNAFYVGTLMILLSLLLNGWLKSRKKHEDRFTPDALS